MSNQREAFNKFCFTADITPSTEHLDIWKAAQAEMEKHLLECAEYKIGQSLDEPRSDQYKELWENNDPYWGTA